MRHHTALSYPQTEPRRHTLSYPIITLSQPIPKLSHTIISSAIPSSHWANPSLNWATPSYPEPSHHHTELPHSHTEPRRHQLSNPIITLSYHIHITEPRRHTMSHPSSHWAITSSNWATPSPTEPRHIITLSYHFLKLSHAVTNWGSTSPMSPPIC